MRSKRRSYRRSYRSGGNNVMKNIAARVAAKLIVDRILRRRSRRSRRSTKVYNNSNRSKRSLSRRSNNDNTKMIIGGIITSYMLYKLYDYYYGEHKIILGPSSKSMSIGGNMMESNRIVLRSNGYDITRLTLNKQGNELYVSPEAGGSTKRFVDKLYYQLSNDGKYYKFGEFNNPYFYINRDDLNKVINFLKE